MGIQQYLAFTVLGFGYGALIAGLAVSYRSSKVVNVAAGVTAAYVAYVYSSLRGTGTLKILVPIQLTPDEQPLATPIAMLIALGVAALLGVLQYLLVYRPLARASEMAKLVASAGVLLTLQAVIVLQWGSNPVHAPAILPQTTVKIFGIPMPWDRLLLAALVIVVTIALWLVYRGTRFGMATRAAADNSKGATLIGLPTGRIECGNWVISSLLAGGFGVLAAPTLQLEPTSFTLLVVPVLTAAIIGSFSSFLVAVAAAFGLGIINSLLTSFRGQAWFPQAEGVPVPGIPELVPFIILAVVLFLRGRSLPDRLTEKTAALPRSPRPRHVRWFVLAGLVIGLAGLAGLSYDWRQALINSMLGVLLCLSVVVTTGFTGQISFAQMTLAGAAAYITSAVGVSAGMPFPIPPIAGVLAAVAISLIIAIPARRVRGMQLAVLTLAGAVAAQQFWFNSPQWGSGLRPASIAPIEIFGLTISPSGSFWGDEAPSPGFGLVVLLVLLVVALTVVWLRRSPLGARMLAVRSSEAAAAAAGVDVARVKVVSFVIGGAIAGIAGVMYGYNLSGVSAERFGPLMSITFFAIAVLGGVGGVSGAVVAGLLVAQGLMFHAVTTWFGISPDFQPLFAGLAVVATMIGSPDGVAASLRSIPIGRLLRRRTVVLAEKEA
ncbi:MAG: hypothetical protein KDB25_07930 [Leucobacter sp.]|nr:hypothetical protein [Leucobacter sp.]